MSDNRLTTSGLPADIFAGLSNLQALLLNGNLPLTELPEGIFNGLTSLTILRLQFNQLTTSGLPANIFADLTMLQTLDLRNNALGELPATIFDGLSNLRTLDLSSNALTSLPDEIFNDLGMLQGVNVSGNTTDPFTLTVTPSGNTPGTAVIEVVEGVPFEVMATVSITGGTFPDNTSTVTIPQGETQSAPFAYTLDANAISATITVTPSNPRNFNIDNNFQTATGAGYSGFRLVGGSDTVGEGICSRTDQVEAAIVAAINAATPSPEVMCNTVTQIQLQGITILNLNDLTPNDDATDENGDTINDNMDDIMSLMSGDFAGLSGLQTLNLSDNMLESLPEGVFVGLTALETLDLSDNDLMSLREGVFSDLMTLETLRLNGNDLTMLPAGVFAGLTSLTGVDVSGNPNDDSPAFTLTLFLNQRGNNFVVEVAEGAPTDLTVNIMVVGGTASSTTATIETGMTESEVIMVTPAEETMELTVTLTNPVPDLSLSPNYSGLVIGASPDPLMFTFGTADICNRTPQVEAAILAAIRADGVSTVMCDTVTSDQLAMITELDLSDPMDDIMSLESGDFAGLTMLETLNLSGNGLTMLDANIFNSLATLTTLNLRENALGTLDADIFASLTMLQTLNLSDNNLTELDADVFDGLGMLQMLDLSNNALEELPDGIFSGLGMLQGVDVSGNTTDPFTLTLTVTFEVTEEPDTTGRGMGVIEVVQGVPFNVRATVTITGGTFVNGTNTETDVTISRGATQAEFAYTEDDDVDTSTGITVSLLMALNDSGSEITNIVNSFDGSTGYSGFALASGTDLGVEERIEEVGESILPSVSRELISGVQRAITGRIGRLATTPVVTPPTAQVAGQSTLSDLLTFSAQTFDRVHNQGQSFAIETLLQDTSFTLSLNGEEGDTSRIGFESLAVWGSVDYQNLSGGDDVSWDGSITSLHIGSDLRVTREALGGISVSWSQGAFDYEDSTSGVNQEGEYELELLSVHPYGGWSPVPWFNLWATGGYGFGEVTVTDNMMTGSQSSDVQSYSGSLGASAERDLEENSVFPGITTLRVKGQTSIAMMDVEGNGQMISGLTTEAYQQRVSLEVSHTCIICENRYVIPTLEIGVRNDAGDGETGNGLEIGGEVEYRAIDLGLRVSVNGRWLAVHSGELEEWGLGGSVRFEPGARGGEGQGFWMSITPEWGETSSRARELWDAKIEDVERASQEREARLGAEAGYGLSIGKALLTPSAGVSLTNQGYRSYRVGSGVIVGQFSLTLEGERRSTWSSSEEESVRLEGSLRF